jgi:hypothetical protein
MISLGLVPFRLFQPAGGFRRRQRAGCDLSENFSARVLHDTMYKAQVAILSSSAPKLEGLL